MEYLKSLTSAVLAQTGGPFPNFNIGEKNTRFEGKTIWSLHAGSKRDDGSAVSILIFDATQPAHSPRRALLPLAQNAARKLRIMRHPDVLRFYDSVETQNAVYIAVEVVKPLADMLEEELPSQSEWVGWGLSRIANALKFINVDANSIHGNVRVESMFIASSGEWKIGGFETLTSTKEDQGVFYIMGNLLPDAARILPPEARQGGCKALIGMPAYVIDSYGLAIAGFEAYNGTLPPTAGVPAQGKVPAPFYSMFKRMLTPNAKTRASTTQFLEQGQAEGGYFVTNRLVQVAAGIDNFMLAAESERGAIVRMLESSPEALPAPFVQYKVLPVLLNALSFQPNPQSTTPSLFQGSKLIPLCLRLAKSMSDTEWRVLMAPAIETAYMSPDRGMRMTLLDNLDAYSDRLDNKMVVEKIWPKLINGLCDSVAAIREATLKSILPLAPKLSDRILNNELLRVLAKTQTDSEPSIRTNTTILIGRLVPFLSNNTKKTVLVPAFARSLKDTFVHARVAGLMALIATGDAFDAEDLARQVLPAAMPCLMDREKIVRDQANKAVDVFLKRVREVAATLPETALPPDGEGTDVSSAAQAVASLRLNPTAASATNAASVLAGWAMSSAMSQFSKQTSASELQNTSMDGNRPGALRGSATLTPAAASSAAAPVLPISPQRANGFKAHSSAASSSAASTTVFSPDPSEDAGEWEAMDERCAAGASAARANLPGILGGSKKLALGAGKKVSLANTILQENAAAAAPLSSRIHRKALAVQQAPAEDEHAWGDSWDTGCGGAPDSGDGAAAAGMSDSMQLTVAAFIDPAPLIATLEAHVPSPMPTPPAGEEEGEATAEPAVAEHDWGTLDDVLEEVPVSAPAPAPAVKVLTKEEKRAEMQRQREERKARMAALKAAKGG
ncbi:ARM repeat-containing protein [Tilletiaria anomala UBC 951]|uniref:ARM repeat-containing protein n=1 Tax=Tilletiaria anomala (strain ATCC 24038 / CBS 436.72 / UBC 951) TaxID=1037660 RepID=A0A066VV38_TILAU|nr:ARM repeat-containing protein [Tilletiaria anomala UBC 951]KDN42390.1 ARM repeat-containing protein [Tilletiaria anomala UBC 951]